MEKTAYIQVKNLCYTYPKSRFSLEDISVELKSGCFTAICGKNGSGKTTLGKLLAGVLKPNGGSILIDGKDAAVLTLGERGRLLGYLFQNPAQQIFAPMVDEELCFIPRLLGWSEKEIAQRRTELTEFFGLAHLLENSTFYLSRGEKQRLALAGMLFLRPPFLLLDEPTTGLDEENRARLAEILRRLLEADIGMVVISHDRAFIDKFVDKELIMLSQGKLAEGGVLL